MSSMLSSKTPHDIIIPVQVKELFLDGESRDYGGLNRYHVLPGDLMLAGHPFSGHALIVASSARSRRGESTFNHMP